MLIVSKMLSEAAEMIDQGRLSDGEALIDEALLLEPESNDAWYFKGMIALFDGRADEASEALAKSVEFDPMSIRNQMALAEAFARTGQNLKAVESYEKLLHDYPDRADWWAVLSGLQYDLGHMGEAEEAARKAIALDESIPEPFLNLTLVLQYRHDFKGAERACRQALSIDGAFGYAHFILGNLYLAQGRHDDAEVCYQEVVRLEPGNAEALINLGNILREKMEIAAAGEYYEAAIKVAPHSALAHSNLGIVFKDQGKMSKAVSAFRRALELDPTLHLARSNFLFCLCFKVEEDPERVYREHLIFDELHAKPLSKSISPHMNRPEPDRRLRVGLLSPDLRIHPGGHFFLPIVDGLDRREFEVICYHNSIFDDGRTSEFRASADAFHQVYHWSDDELADRIRADRIDILIEGAGHMAGNRMLVAARKPAPVQITTPLYPNTTGLSTMDYCLLDEQVALPSVDRFYSEEIIRLPETHFCYRPLETSISPAEEPPAVSTGYVSFGSFNNAIKLNEKTVEIWSKVLNAVPNSRLVLKWLEFDRPESAGILDRFAEYGVDPSRIERFGRTPEPYSSYRDLDICLDPILASGGTTTCDALWMGVPVVTFAGQSQFSRTGVMHLNNIGLPNLIAATEESFVDIAVRLASDVPYLTDIRRGLRERMQASPIMDEPKYCRFLEAELRRVWHLWCQSQTKPMADLPR